TAGSCGSVSAALTYSWSLTTPAGSSTSLSNASSATPSLTADVFGGGLLAQVTPTHAPGNTPPPPTPTLPVSTCGAAPLLPKIDAVPGALAFDDHVFTASPANGTVFSSDETAGCPARFVQYAFAWSVVSSAPKSGFTLSSPSTNPVTFTPGG